MKLIFKKMILASVLSLAGITYAQYYPNDNYGNNQYGNNSYEFIIILMIIITNILMITTLVISIEDLIMIIEMR